MNKIIIVICILLASNFVIGNITQNGFAYFLIWPSKAWVLSLGSIVTGVILGIAIQNLISNPKNNDDEDWD